MLNPWIRVLLEKLTGFQLAKKFPRVLWKPKVHYRIHTCLPPAPILSQPDPVHVSTSHYMKMHLNIILLSPSGYCKWSLSLRIPHQNPVYASPLPHTCYMLRLSILLDLITRTIFGEQYRPLSSSLCSFFFHSPVTSSLLGPDILLNTLFSNPPPSLRFSPNVRDKFHTHTKQQAKLFLCISYCLNFYIPTWKIKYSAPNDSKHSLT